MRRLVAHIGMQKAGSASIQTWLRSNAAALAGLGVHHAALEDGAPRYNHHVGFGALACDLQGVPIPEGFARRFEISSPADAEARLADFVARFDGSLADAPGVHVVSSEFISFHLKGPKGVRAFRDWAAARFSRVDVVIYLRNQLDWAASRYAQQIKMGGTKELRSIAEAVIRVDYDRLVARWEDAFGEDAVHPRLMESSGLASGDLIADLCGFLGVEPAGFPEAERVNEAMGAEQLEAVRQLNVQIAASGAPRALARLRKARRRRIAAETGGDKLTLDGEIAREVLLATEASNEALRARRFPERARLFSNMDPADVREDS